MQNVRKEFEGGKGFCYLDIWVKTILGRRNSQYKAVKEGVCLVNLRNDMEGHVICYKDFHFPLKEMQNHQSFLIENWHYLMSILKRLLWLLL
jgi:hypothetical protein